MFPLLVVFGCALLGPPDKEALLPVAKSGDIKQVKKLIARGVDPNRADPLGVTPLMQAAEAGHLNIVRHLVGKGVDVNAIDHRPLGEGGGYAGRTALEKAVSREHPAVAEFLIKKGARVSAFAMVRLIHLGADLTEQALLHLDGPQSAQDALTGVLRAKKWQVAERLLVVGARVRKADRAGNTPLHWAAGWGDIEMIAFLLKHGAKINQANRFQRTPLDIAAGMKRIKIVRYLLARKANIRRGAPLAAALQSIPQGVNSQQTLELVRYLLRRRANVNRADPRFGETPLMRAARSGDLVLVELLVSRRARINRKSRFGLTALQIARQNKHSAVEAYLLKRGAR